MSLAVRYFPESDKSWYINGREIHANLQSTKKVIEEEVAETRAINQNILQEPGGQYKGTDLTGYVNHKV